MSEFTPTPLASPATGTVTTSATIVAKPRRWTAIIVGIAFLAGLIVMAGAVYYGRAWLSAAPTQPATAAKTALPVVVVPAAGAPAGPAPMIDLNALSTRESQLAGRLTDLEQRTAQATGAAQAASGYATRSENMLVAFAARRALDRGLALGYVEDQLRDRFGATQPRAVAAILQAAREPVTIAELRVGLDGIAPDLVTGRVNSGWLASLRREVSNLVVIHRADTPSPLPADRLARARQMLEGGKVEAALAEVARMPGAPQAVRWTSAARRYIGARQALDTIEAAAITGQANPIDVPGIALPTP